jgi:hypothetical protein
MPGRIAGKYNPTATAEINRRTQQYAARTGAMPSPQQISQLEAAAVNKGNWIEDALAVSLTDRRAMKYPRNNFFLKELL